MGNKATFATVGIVAVALGALALRFNSEPAEQQRSIDVTVPPYVPRPAEEHRP